jgi:hypothetical protein
LNLGCAKGVRKMEIVLPAISVICGVGLQEYIADLDSRRSKATFAEFRKSRCLFGI